MDAAAQISVQGKTFRPTQLPDVELSSFSQGAGRRLLTAVTESVCQLLGTPQDAKGVTRVIQFYIIDLRVTLKGTISREEHYGQVSITPSMMSDVSSSIIGPFKTLNKLSELGENWDGFGSPPITPVAIASARNLLQELTLDKLPTPYIGPVTGGGVQIELYTPNRELELEILPDGSIEYVIVDEEGRLQDGLLPSTDDERVQEFNRWLIPPSTDMERA